jgi:hypothetical protein
MAIFESNLIQQSTITTAALVWDPSNVSTSAFGPNGAVTVLTPAQTLRDVTIVNTGSNTVWLGGSTVTAATGLALPAGAQITYNGYVATAGSTTGRIYGISTSGTTVEVGLATVNANV